MHAPPIESIGSHSLPGFSFSALFHSATMRKGQVVWEFGRAIYASPHTHKVLDFVAEGSIGIHAANAAYQ